MRRGGDEPPSPRSRTRDARRRPPRRRLRRAPARRSRGHGRVRRRARGVPARRRRGRPRPARVHCAVAIGKDLYVMCGDRPHPARRRVGADTETWSGRISASSAPARLLLRLLLRRLLLPPRRGFPGFSRAEGFRHRRRRPRDVRDPPLRRVRRPEMAQRRVDWTPPPADSAPSPSRRPAPRSGHAMTAAETPRRFRGQAAGGALRDLWVSGRRRSRRRDNEQHRRPARSGRPGARRAADTAVAAGPAAAVEPSRVARPGPDERHRRPRGASQARRREPVRADGHTSPPARLPRPIVRGHGDDGAGVAAELLRRRACVDAPPGAGAA